MWLLHFRPTVTRLQMYGKYTWTDPLFPGICTKPCCQVNDNPVEPDHPTVCWPYESIVKTVRLAMLPVLS